MISFRYEIRLEFAAEKKQKRNKSKWKDWEVTCWKAPRLTMSISCSLLRAPKCRAAFSCNTRCFQLSLRADSVGHFWLPLHCTGQKTNPASAVINFNYTKTCQTLSFSVPAIIVPRMGRDDFLRPCDNYPAVLFFSKEFWPDARLFKKFIHRVQITRSFSLVIVQPSLQVKTVLEMIYLSFVFFLFFGVVRFCSTPFISIRKRSKK